MPWGAEMTAAPLQPLMTADDLLAMPDGGKRYELIDGRLVELCPASWISSTVAMNIAIRLGPYVRDHGLGKVSGADHGAKLATNPDLVRSPDVAFTRQERLKRGKLTRGFQDGAPDLVVEVLSPTDRFAQVVRKVQQYLRAGAQLVWVLDPSDREAIVYRADGSTEVYGADGILSGEDVVPGFELRLAEIWEDADEDEDDEPADNETVGE